MEWNGLALHPAHPAIMKPDEPIIVSSMPEFDALMSSARTSYRIASSHRRRDVPAYRRVDAQSRGRRGRAVVVPSRDSPPRARRRASRRSSFPCMYTRMHARPLCRTTGRSTRKNEEDGRKAGIGSGRTLAYASTFGPGLRSSSYASCRATTTTGTRRPSFLLFPSSVW